MTAAHPARLEALFSDLIECEPDDRERRLSDLSTTDPALAQLLRGLLDRDARLEGHTARPAFPGLEAELGAAQRGFEGLRIGPWRVLEEIGRGGMGRVHRAERDDATVSQRVAIKFLAPGRIGAEDLRRFHQERRMLASLEHPNIARLLDAAALSDGTPYLVMEYVDGAPITVHCERVGLDLRGRIELLRRVCAAVAAAHRQLIVHRDIKPGNVLVTATGEPKLLDFGIAKVLDAEAMAGDATHTAARFFSPHYAAPEQLRGDPVGVACDVHALGLIAYELVTGRRPFEFEGRSIGEIERLITQVPPPSPSSALASAAEAPPGIRARELRGDLDGIILRCLRKAPVERYTSVEQLEADLSNYLEGRPVLARGGHRWYRAQKFVRRNAVAVSAGGLAVASLVAGVLAFAWQARVAQQRAQQLAEVAGFQAELLAQFDPARAANDLKEVLGAELAEGLERAGVPAPDRAARSADFEVALSTLNATDAARHLLDRFVLAPAAESIPQKFAAQPRVEAQLTQALAERYREIGLPERAAPLQARSLELHRLHFTPDEPELAGALGHAAILEINLHGGKAAIPLMEEAYAHSRRAYGEHHEETLMALANVGFAHSSAGNLDEAERWYREALEQRMRHLGPDHSGTQSSRHNLGSLMIARGRLEEAEPLLQQALAGYERLYGPDHEDTLGSASQLGLLRMREQRIDEAIPYLERAWHGRRRAFGDDHPATQQAMMNVGAALLAAERTREAEPLLERALAEHRRTSGESSLMTLIATQNWGELLRLQGRAAEAEAVYRDLLPRARNVLGPHHAETLKITESYGGTLIELERFGEAHALLAPVETHARAAFEKPVPRRLARFLLNLGQAKLGLGEHAAAEPLLRKAEALMSGLPRPRRGDRAQTAAALARLYHAWNRAQPSAERAAAAREWSAEASARRAPPG